MPQQKMLEIARAIGAEARVLIMDEPTASLSDEDAQNLFSVVRRLRSRGVGIIYISHRLDELPELADRVTVLRDGCTIQTRPMNEVNREELIRLTTVLQPQPSSPNPLAPKIYFTLSNQNNCGQKRLIFLSPSLPVPQSPSLQVPISKK